MMIKNLRVFFVVSFLLALMAHLGCASFMIDSRGREQKVYAMDYCVSQGKLNYCFKYLNEYPTGKYKKRVLNKLQEILNEKKNTLDILRSKEGNLYYSIITSPIYNVFRGSFSMTAREAGTLYEGYFLEDLDRVRVKSEECLVFRKISNLYTSNMFCVPLSGLVKVSEYRYTLEKEILSIERCL